MNKTELRHIAEDLVDELRELPDGAEITSGQLLKRIGYDPKELSEEELLGYHEALLRTAKVNHITLDMSKHEYSLEGLPWNLDFVVRNEKAQIKCPRCGSRNTARIQYGMPAFTEEFQEKLNAGRVHIGGCCIDGFRTEDGEWISLDPTRYCNCCKKAFAKPAYWKKQDQIFRYVDMVKAVELKVESYRFINNTTIRIEKNDQGAIVHVDHFSLKLELPPEGQTNNSFKMEKTYEQAFQ